MPSEEQHEYDILLMLLRKKITCIGVCMRLLQTSLNSLVPKKNLVNGFKANVSSLAIGPKKRTSSWQMDNFVLKIQLIPLYLKD